MPAEPVLHGLPASCGLADSGRRLGRSQSESREGHNRGPSKFKFRTERSSSRRGTGLSGMPVAGACPAEPAAVRRGSGRPAAANPFPLKPSPCAAPTA